jgi:hypothetical protein
MKTFKEFCSEDDDLSEQAQVKKGNWKGGKDMVLDISKTGIDLYYKKIDTIKFKGKEHILYLNTEVKDKENYILGYFETETIQTKVGPEEYSTFMVQFGITFSKYKNTKTYATVHNVDGVGVKTTNAGYSKFMYKYFVKNKGYTIIGDNEQYFGARKLWSRLSKELDVIVDIYDLKSDSIIESNVVLHHGNYNNDFDERLWSYSKNKDNIRSILIDIKD